MLKRLRSRCRSVTNIPLTISGRYARCASDRLSASTLTTPGETRVMGMARLVVQLSSDDVQRPQRRNGIGNRLSGDHVTVCLENREAGRTAADAVRILR